MLRQNCACEILTVKNIYIYIYEVNYDPPPYRLKNWEISNYVTLRHGKSEFMISATIFLAIFFIDRSKVDSCTFGRSQRAKFESLIDSKSN